MDIKPIRSEADYENALREINILFNADPSSPEGEKLEILIILVEDYEERHHQIPLPDPIDAIEYHMERMNLDRKDLEAYIGSRARVSEVLNRVRPLSIRMMRQLSAHLGIPIEVLAQPYTLRASARRVKDSLRSAPNP